MADDKIQLRRGRLRLADLPPNALYPKSREEVPDPFQDRYDKNELLTPPYNFQKLYQIYEESDVVQSCVKALVQNIDGFGFTLQFLGDDRVQKDSPEALAEKNLLFDIFNQVNDRESFTRIRKRCRIDLEALGNCTMEIIRDGEGQIALFQYVPTVSCRMGKLDAEPTKVDVTLRRGGKTVTVPIYRYFRKFAQVWPSGKIIWFREFGDTRPLDSETGSREKVNSPANEIVWKKHDFGGMAYGLPQYIGAILDIIGRRKAQFVNLDLFDSQGIPPFMVLVSNGTLTDESFAELEALINSMRGAENFNRGAVLEATSDSAGLDETNRAKLDIKFMTENRQNDMMFGTYKSDTATSGRQCFRLPPLYLGGTEDYSRATAIASMIVAEQQVFSPERNDFDEWVNLVLLKQELSIKFWKFTSVGPPLVGADEFINGVKEFSAAGALTINHAIDMANEAFGLQMSKMDFPWADMPLVLVTELMKKGIPLKGLATMVEEDDAARTLMSFPQAYTGLEPGQSLTRGNIAKGDIPLIDNDAPLDDVERELYRKLLLFDKAATKHMAARAVTENDLPV